MAWLWPKELRRDLARYVTPDAGDLVTVPVRRIELEQRPEGRRELAAAIYETLSGLGIRYATERYHPSAALQHIRTPEEILRSPHEGTCLDLATLFCGVCLANELLPILIVLEGHALAAVSMTHGLRQWDAMDRREQPALAGRDGITAADLRALVDSGAYLAVECTGFASVSEFSTNVPEGIGRHHGLLPFEQAIAAGRAQLDRPDRPLDIAIDIATARWQWRVEPEPLVDATPGTIHAGRFTVTTGSSHGAVLDPAPKPELRARAETVRLLPSPFPGLLDRSEETALARTAADRRGVLQVYAGDGWGKSALVHHVAHLPELISTPRSIVYLSGAGKPLDDVCYYLFQACFVCDVVYRPTEEELCEALHALDAIVVIDDSGLTRDELERLRDHAPGSSMVLTTTTRTLWSDTAIHLGGLPEDAGAELISRELGRPLTAAEESAAGRLVKQLGGQPLRLLQAAAHARHRDIPIDQLETCLDVGAPETSLVAETLRHLSASERRVLEALARMLGVPASADEVASVTGVRDTGHILADLERRHLALARSPTYTVPRDIAAGLPGSDEDTVRAFGVMTEWAAAHRGRSDELAARAEGINTYLAWAEAAGHDPTEILRLVHAGEEAMALSGRWGAWRRALEVAHHAAQRSSDTATVAWAEHQLGTCLGCVDSGVSSARRLLESARDTRLAIGDELGAAVSQHNIDALTLPPLPTKPPETPPQPPAPPPRQPPSRGWLARHPLVAGTLAVLLVAGGVLGVTRPWQGVDRGDAVTTGPVATVAQPTPTQPTEPPATPAPSAELTVRPDAVEFGEVPVDGEARQEIVVGNPGPGELFLAGAEASGPGFWSHLADCEPGSMLAPGAECRIVVTFAPGEPGDFGGTLTIWWGSPEVTAAVRLHGLAPEPEPRPTMTDPQPDPDPPPGPVADLVVAPGGGSGELMVSWARLAEDDMIGYDVFHGENASGPWSLLTWVAAGDPWPAEGRIGFIDFGRHLDGATHCYQVSAVDEAGQNGPFATGCIESEVAPGPAELVASIAEVTTDYVDTGSIVELTVQVDVTNVGESPADLVSISMEAELEYADGWAPVPYLAGDHDGSRSYIGPLGPGETWPVVGKVRIEHDEYSTSVSLRATIDDAIVTPVYEHDLSDWFG